MSDGAGHRDVCVCVNVLDPFADVRKRSIFGAKRIVHKSHRTLGYVRVVAFGCKASERKSENNYCRI